MKDPQRDRMDSLSGCLDYFCKKVLRNYARNYWEKKHRNPTLPLPDTYENVLHTKDPDPIFEHCYTVQGYSVAITNEILGNALETLPAGKRDILFLYYFFNLTDQEIAQLLSLKRSTVQYQRTQAIKQIRKIMEES